MKILNRYQSFSPRMGRRTYLTLIFVVLELVVFSLSSQYFFTIDNLSSILRNSIELGIVAIGMTMVIILGGIDISVGASLGIVAIVIGRMLNLDVSPFIICIAAILTGGIIGLINGAIIVFGKIPEIIVTIGTMYILRAAIFGLLGGRWITGLPPIFKNMTGDSLTGTIVLLVFIILLYTMAHILLTHFRFGRYIYAIGSNKESAFIVGINPDTIRIITYTIIGVLTGIAALFYVNRLANVEITVGQDLHIQVIAAVVIGGTSVLGGIGSIPGTLAGVFFMAILRNGINILGVPSLWEKVFIGIFIILSVLIDSITNKKNVYEN